MKEIYESPIFDVVEYETEDVITTSMAAFDNEFDNPWGKIN